MEEKNEALKNENEIWVKQLKDQANKFAQLLNDQNAKVEPSKKPNIGRFVNDSNSFYII